MSCSSVWNILGVGFREAGAATTVRRDDVQHVAAASILQSGTLDLSLKALQEDSEYACCGKHIPVSTSKSAIFWVCMLAHVQHVAACVRMGGGIGKKQRLSSSQHCIAMERPLNNLTDAVVTNEAITHLNGPSTITSLQVRKGCTSTVAHPRRCPEEASSGPTKEDCWWLHP
jgi:hypothetical protein